MSVMGSGAICGAIVWGPLFQGTIQVPFRLMAKARGALLASEYLQLNPVRVKGLGLGKRGRKAEGVGIAPPPTAEMVKTRLETLRDYRWSSYRAYAGVCSPNPNGWTCEDLWQRAKHDDLTPTGVRTGGKWRSP